MIFCCKYQSKKVKWKRRLGKQKQKKRDPQSCCLIHSTISDLYPKKYNIKKKKKILFAGLMPNRPAFNLIPNACFFFSLFLRIIPNLYLKVTNQTSNWPYFLDKKWKCGLHACLASSTIYLCTKIPSSCGTHVRLTSLLLVFCKRILEAFTLVTV